MPEPTTGSREWLDRLDQQDISDFAAIHGDEIITKPGCSSGRARSAGAPRRRARGAPPAVHRQAWGGSDLWHCTSVFRLPCCHA